MGRRGVCPMMSPVAQRRKEMLAGSTTREAKCGAMPQERSRRAELGGIWMPAPT